MVGCVEGILGIRPDLDGLTLAPSIPSQWKQLEMNKIFRGKKLHIMVANPSGKESGCTSLILNGQKLSNAYIPEKLLLDENDI